MNSSDSVIKTAPKTIELWSLPQFGQPKELPFAVKNQFVDKKQEEFSSQSCIQQQIAQEVASDDLKAVSLRDKEIQEEAIKAAYEKGISEGREAGLQEQSLRDQELKILLSEQTALTESLSHAFSKGQQKVESLLQEGLKKFFHSFLMHSPSDRIRWLEEEVNRTLVTNQLLKIYVAPESMSSWMKIWPKFSNNFYPHPDLKEKDCLIEFDSFFLDGRLQTLLEHLCKEITDDDNQFFPTQTGQGDQVSAGGH